MWHAGQPQSNGPAYESSYSSSTALSEILHLCSSQLEVDMPFNGDLGKVISQSLKHVCLSDNFAFGPTRCSWPCGWKPYWLWKLGVMVQMAIMFPQVAKAILANEEAQNCPIAVVCAIRFRRSHASPSWKQSAFSSKCQFRSGSGTPSPKRSTQRCLWSMGSCQATCGCGNGMFFL
jgi:hypothetical protein